MGKSPADWMDGVAAHGGLSALFTHFGGFLLTGKWGQNSELLPFARLTCNMQIFVRL